MRLASLVAAICLVVLHLTAGKMRFLEGIPRSRWLSVAGGVSVAYIFIHVLPELSSGQEVVSRATGERLPFLEHHIYLVALLGLLAFYGLDRMALLSREHQRQKGAQEATSPGVFRLHIASFAVYNGIIGYLLLHREVPGLAGLFFFAVAMGLHYLVTDYGLREQHQEAYGRTGRWVLAAATLAGWGVGYVTAVPRAVIALLFAFLAGGVILNVLKEELPKERKSRFWAFAVGIVGYTILLLTL